MSETILLLQFNIIIIITIIISFCFIPCLTNYKIKWIYWTRILILFLGQQ